MKTCSTVHCDQPARYEVPVVIMPGEKIIAGRTKLKCKTCGEYYMDLLARHLHGESKGIFLDNIKTLTETEE